MRLAVFVAGALSFAILAGCASAPPPAADAAARIRADVAWLADDARQGREAGTAGYDAAADYVEARMKAAGLAPAASGWRQTTPLRSSVRVADKVRFMVGICSASTVLVPLDDFIVGRSYDAPTASVTAPLVYAGHGVVAPDDGVDDYAGIDVSGKIVLVFDGAPMTLGPEQHDYYSSIDAKLVAAAARGAIGFVELLRKEEEAGASWRSNQRFLSAANVITVAPDGRAEIAAPTIKATAALSVPGATKVFAGEQLEFDQLQAIEAQGMGAPKGFPLLKTATISGSSRLMDMKSDNVIGIIEGSDPALRDEVVVLTAHLDHLGVAAPQSPGDDLIYNGAIDNAGGVATLLEAARALAASKARPRRTIAFAAVTGEEQGLLGASYLARHPVFGAKRIVANVNIDMPVALYPFTDVIAYGEERSSLGASVGRAARSMGIAVSPDPMPDEHLFVRSDHFGFVMEGTPAIFLVTGYANGGADAYEDFLMDHYHQPSDDISLPINYQAIATFAELHRRLASDIANDDETPSWVEGDFYGDLFSR